MLREEVEVLRFQMFNVIDVIQPNHQPKLID